jgi:cyclase
MLKTRVIPTLLWKGPGLVKGVGFDSSRRVGTVLPAIRVYNMRDVDEIVLVDIAATLEARRPDWESIADFSSECFVPLTIGGGVRCLDDVMRLLRAGADKVSINTAFFEDPSLVRQSAARFGSQCIVVSLDARQSGDDYVCYSRSGSKDTGWNLVDAAVKAQEAGAGEILLTSIERDGTMSGYDIPMVEMITKAVTIPVIASGGAGALEHFPAAVRAGASAVAAASLFHFTETTPAQIRHIMASHGIPVRK